MMWEVGELPLSCVELTLFCFFLISIFSSAHSCTASLHGSVTCMCRCWTGCMSTTPLSTRVASSCARTTALTKLSSSRCEPLDTALRQSCGRRALKGGGKKMRWGADEGVWRMGSRGRGETGGEELTSWVVKAKFSLTMAVWQNNATNCEGSVVIQCLGLA